ncbi:MAG: DUF368 domain-containing protein [Pontiellaceae bacterium]|nr:DUF368 domain-containing protein [Pontiellaceae bacterium]
MINFIGNMIRGALMGAANVIPGVSGGTMALLTGIFERLINAIKSFDITAFRLLFKFKIRELWKHTDATFLLAVGIGVVGSILTLSRTLEYLFDHYPLYVWSFFFGLILASIYFVGKKIKTPNVSVILIFLIGAAIAGTLAFMKPAEENASIPYLLLCGAVGMCSMILPGLSGSYVLLLMGNYKLVMIKAVSDLDLMILVPVVVGAVAGLTLFSRILALIFQKLHNQTLALLTGFIFGSLSILWPWKEAVTETFKNGDRIKEKVIGYSYELPDFNSETLLAVLIMLSGIGIIALTEMLAGKTKKG